MDPSPPPPLHSFIHPSKHTSTLRSPSPSSYHHHRGTHAPLLPIYDSPDFVVFLPVLQKDDLLKRIYLTMVFKIVALQL